MKKIIGFTGKKQSGKDTACDSLEGYTKMSFAEPMREILNLVTVSPEGYDYDEHKEDEVLELVQSSLLRGIIDRCVEDLLETVDNRHSGNLYLLLMDKFSNKKFSAREFLQVLGTDWARNTVDENIWLKKVVKKAQNHEGNVAISDVRFDNEAECIKHSNGIIVHLTRDGQDSQDNHESENGISEELIDHKITAKDPEELANKVAVVDATYDLILDGEGGEIEEIANNLEEIQKDQPQALVEPEVESESRRKRLQIMKKGNKNTTE